ncbi:recombinase family protein [Altererythrobacter sp. GH1-8]|uniref:recombinase family protein n=1 Tax=Altererythrobacter sp. GH1-8 TaxID=3349333 RepID=UPI00374D7184
MKSIRCAIYTRKSSEEGLEQDFNSLDAQREACAAYVLSQASEGWKLLPDVYDDGGLSGGSLERPALQRLLEDVKDGRVDIIVVYKVDRLTRSLLDFARLVEAFDAAEVSFVSVTQSFNTTTSMGRLTLNMLLSFAQFEREVTAERIRDKIAASKAKGMWMGGTPPLGYEPDGRSLRTVEEHVAIVRDIFARYRRLGNVRLVAEELACEGITTPRRQTANGKCYGGCAFTRGKLYHLLRNPVYAGDIGHKGKTYPGNHPAIIPREEWEAVQQQLTENVRGTRTAREASTAMLAGKLFDQSGEALIPVHTSKPCTTGGTTSRRRYRYYVSKSAHHYAETSMHDSMRIPAREIEQAVASELVKALADPLALARQLKIDIAPAQYARVTSRLAQSRGELGRLRRSSINPLVDRVTIHPDRLELVISAQALAEMLGLHLDPDAPPSIRHIAKVRLTRSGQSLRLVDGSGIPAGSRGPDPTLLKLVAQAHQWWGILSRGEVDATRLADQEGVSVSWITRVVRLAFLSPQLVEAILAGKAPAALDGKALLATGAIAPSWDEQARGLLGAGVTACAQSPTRTGS